MTKPLLTPAEKAFLQAVIKPYRKWVRGIEKVYHQNLMCGYPSYKHTLKIHINARYLSNILLPIDDLSNSYQFKGLELDTLYELKTLGL